MLTISLTFRPVTVPSRRAVSVSSWIWSRPWCADIIDSLRVSVYLHGRPTPGGDDRSISSSGVTCSLPPKPPPTSGAMTRILCSGVPVSSREQKPQDVRDLGRRPHRDLVAGRVDDDAARLHERRDQPLLAVLALDDDRLAGVGDRVVDVAAGARLGRVEDPGR